MNIWEFIGLPADHRPEDKTVQLVKHFADVAHKITYPVIAQRKFDGVYALTVCRDEEAGIFGRTGRMLTNVDHLKPAIIPKGKVAYIAELCCDKCSLEVLSGLVNPNRKRQNTPEEAELIASFYLVYHDLIYISELIEGESKRPYWLRQLDLYRHSHDLADLKALIATSVDLNTPEDCEWFAQEQIQDDAEGAVFKDKNAGWIAGRKNEVATKIVKGVDFDLLVTGIEEGKGKHKGMVGKLIVRWFPYGVRLGAESINPAIDLPVDGCFTQEMRKEWFTDTGKIIGKVVHVHALCIGSKGALRLPKVKAVRIDKTTADL
jgi:hypothetical protein